MRITWTRRNGSDAMVAETPIGQFELQTNLQSSHTTVQGDEWLAYTHTVRKNGEYVTGQEFDCPEDAAAFVASQVASVGRAILGSLCHYPSSIVPPVIRGVCEDVSLCHNRDLAGLAAILSDAIQDHPVYHTVEETARLGVACVSCVA